MKLKLLAQLLFLFISISLYSQVANQPSDIEICDNLGSNDGFATFDLTVNDAQIFGTQNSNDFSITYHLTQSDADSGIGALSNAMSFINTSNPQTIYARITENSSGNFDTTSFLIQVSLLPDLNQPTSLQVCDFDSDGLEIFDLTQKIPEILNGQNPNEFNVEFYTAGTLISDPTNFMNIMNPTVIEVQVSRVSTGCTSIVSFVLIVSPSPELTQPSPLVVCDFDGDGFAAFDLNVAIPEILGDMDPTGITITFYETLANANNGVNPLPSPYMNIVNPQTVYVRADDDITGCFAITTLDLIVSDCEDIGQIVVEAYSDANENSLFDSDENNFRNGYFTYEINNDGIINSVTATSGRFILNVDNDTDSYNFTYVLNDGQQNCFSIPITTIENISVNAGESVSVQFPVVAENACQDLAVFLYNPLASPRPGFTFSNKITLRNLGNQPIASGTVEFLNDAMLQYNSVTSINSNYTVNTIPGGISIDFVDLMPNDIEDITVSLYCDNTVTLGSLVTNVLNYVTTDSDTNSSNNTSMLSQIVIGSYDPNDIAESHGPKIVYDDFIASDGYLYYTIRFQNIGTAEAINIRIEDILDSQLDESTFQMLRSSHDYVVTRTNNELIWQFENINLPSESMDAEASNGFVYFKIKPQTGYGIGDIIPNFADIYFDFNTAITTNVFNTEFVQSLSVEDLTLSTFSIYPNPATAEVTLQFDKVMDGSITVFDIQGKMILNTSISNSKQAKLDVSALESGLYFLKVNSGFNEIIKKLIIK